MPINVQQPETLGIIAGNRGLPIALAREARQAGVQRLVAVAFDGETNPALTSNVDEMIWLKVGQLDKLIDAFTSRGVTQCVMVGQIAPKNLFNLRPDMRAVKLLARLKQKNAHTIFGAIADELKKDGVELISAMPWLTSQMPAKGFKVGEPSSNQAADLQYGFQIAKEISRLEIGQTVVVKNGTVLAVEGFEGTDSCLKRGGELAGSEGGATAVKVAKLDHDTRFDLPCIGDRTVKTCAAAGIHALGFEAGRTILLDQPEVEMLCKKHRILLTAL